MGVFFSKIFEEDNHLLFSGNIPRKFLLVKKGRMQSHCAILVTFSSPLSGSGFPKLPVVVATISCRFLVFDNIEFFCMESAVFA